MRPCVSLTFLPAIAVTCCIDLLIYLNWPGVIRYQFSLGSGFIFNYRNFDLCIAKEMFSEKTVKCANKPTYQTSVN